MIRTSKLAISVLSALLLLVLAAACAPAATPAPTEVPPTPTALQMPTAEPATAAPATTHRRAPTTNAAGGEVTGASLYQVSCAACHGADLKGSTFDMDGQKIDVPALAWDDLSTTFQTQPAAATWQRSLGWRSPKGRMRRAPI